MGWWTRRGCSGIMGKNPKGKTGKGDRYVWRKEEKGRAQVC